MIKNVVMIAIAITAMTLISCNEDEDTPAVVASFNADIDQATGEVTFTNTSENATVYAWDFDDGEVSTLENPTHTFDPGVYTVTLVAANADGDADTFSQEITITDATAPVITLLGDSPFCLSVGATYTDPGATAEDGVDGDVSSSIVVDASAVDSSTPGTYEVTYNVSDAEGNAAVQVTRGVVVSAVFDVAGNLVTNGSFSDGATGWVTNYGDNVPEIRTEGCNDYFFAEVTTPGDAFLVNLTQVLEITQGNTYTLSFEASSDRARTIIAGIGLNEGEFPSANKTINLTAEPQIFTIECLFAGSFGGANSRVFFDMNGDAGIVVLDKVSLVATDPCEAPAPTTAAPTPTRDAGTVISLFSDAYTDVTVDTWRTEWSSAVYEEIMVEGNAVKKYAAMDFVGVETQSAKVDASNMTHIHVDVWSPDFTQFSLKLVDFAATGNSEHQVDYFNPVKEEWISYDIPLSSFTGLANKADIAQYIFVGRPIGLNTIYLDNIYFYNDPDAGGGGTLGSELTINGDFEQGDVTGWTSFAAENNGTFTVTDVQKKDGTYSGLLKADVDGGAGGASFPLVKQANIGIGTVTAGATVTVSFDLFGSLAGAGGVVFAELFSELSGEGVSKTEILGSGPVFPNDTWTNYSFTTTLGDDVSGGITLQLKADCGANGGCVVEAYFDNVSVKVVE